MDIFYYKVDQNHIDISFTFLKKVETFQKFDKMRFHKINYFPPPKHCAIPTFTCFFPHFLFSIPLASFSRPKLWSSSAKLCPFSKLTILFLKWPAMRTTTLPKIRASSIPSQEGKCTFYKFHTSFHARHRGFSSTGWGHEIFTLTHLFFNWINMGKKRLE